MTAPLRELKVRSKVLTNQLALRPFGPAFQLSFGRGKPLHVFLVFIQGGVAQNLREPDHPIQWRT